MVHLVCIWCNRNKIRMLLNVVIKSDYDEKKIIQRPVVTIEISHKFPHDTFYPYHQNSIILDAHFFLLFLKPHSCIWWLDSKNCLIAWRAQMLQCVCHNFCFFLFNFMKFSWCNEIFMVEMLQQKKIVNFDIHFTKNSTKLSTYFFFRFLLSVGFVDAFVHTQNNILYVNLLDVQM